MLTAAMAVLGILVTVAGGAAGQEQDGPSVDPAARGPLDAPVTIIEYSDFQCPFSRRAFPALKAAVDRYPGKVRWVFRGFPLPFHPQARLAHEAALAAGEWDLFWEMHHGIFAAAPGSLTREALVEMAVGAGIPREDFEVVLDSRAGLSRVEQEIREGRSRGVTGTPTFFINGERVSGAQPTEVFDYYLRRALGLPARLPSTAAAGLFLKDPEADHPLARGPLDASLVVKIFLDFRSPLTTKALPAIRELTERYHSRVRFVLKGRPLGIYHDSPVAHQAVLALVKRGADVYQVARLAASSPIPITTALSGRWARRLGLDEKAEAAVEQEVRDGVHRRRVEEELQVAKRIGVKGSPTLLAGGTRFDGVEGLGKFARELEGSPELRLKSRGKKELSGDAAAKCDERFPPSGETAPFGLVVETAGAPSENLAVHDFGEIASGAAVSHQFQVKNVGSTPLGITRVSASPVLAVRQGPRKISPGSSALFEVVFASSEEHRGEVKHGFILNTDRPENPQLGFLLRGKVSHEIQVSPPGGLRIRAASGYAESAALEIRVRGEESSSLSLRTTVVAGARVALEETAPGRRFALRVELPAAAPVGEATGMVKLSTSHASIGEILIPLSILVQPEFLVTPPSLRLPLWTERPATARPLWIRVQSTRLVPFAIRGIRSNLEFLRLEPSQAPAEVDHRLLVIVEPSLLPTEEATGEVVISVAGSRRGEEAHQLRIPVRLEAR